MYARHHASRPLLQLQQLRWNVHKLQLRSWKILENHVQPQLHHVFLSAFCTKNPALSCKNL